MQTTMRERLADILAMIATHNPDAKQAIRDLNKDDIEGKGVDVKIGFDVFNNTARGERCECWFELEYCDFIHGRLVDEDMLKRTCDNIRRGMCTHVSEGAAKSNVSQSYVRLLHIAAGSSNKEIVKLLLKLNKDICYSPSACGMRPFHIALAKSCSTVISYLMEVRQRWQYGRLARLQDCDIVLAKREQESGKVVIQSPYLQFSNVTNIIYITEEIDGDLIRQLVPLYKRYYLCCQLLKCLLCTGRQRLAYQFLQELQVNYCEGNFWHLVVYCVLSNDKECLRLLLKRKIRYLKRSLRKLGYNLLDIAKTFGSDACFDTLKSSHRLTEDVHQKISPYTFLFKFAKESSGMDPDFMVRMITKLQSLCHDVNHEDSLKMTPLLYAIGLVRYDQTIFRKLLSIGADVNAKDRNGRTPLYSAITPYNCPIGLQIHCGQRGLIKDLLLYNPDINCSSTQTSMHHAAEKDLHSNSYLQYLNKGCVKFKASSMEEDDEDIEATSYEDRFIALSHVGLLYELGFVMNSKALQYMSNKHHVQKISDYLNKMESTPRTLQSSCRIAVRKAYPGRLLQSVIDESQLPKRLQNYVVKPYILRHVDIEMMNSAGAKLVIHVDL